MYRAARCHANLRLLKMPYQPKSYRNNFQNAAKPNKKKHQQNSFLQEKTGVFGRHWRKIGSGEINDSNSFSVLSYNLLAESSALSNASLYSFIKNTSQVLKFATRRDMLFKEIETYKGDILCLQEIDEKDFRLSIDPYFTNKGYNSVYCKRQAKDKDDGSCIFWKNDRFRCLEGLLIPLNGDPGNAFLDKPNEAVAVILEFNGLSKKRVCVVTTHLYFNMKRGMVKIGQINFILETVQKMIEKHGRDIPLIFAGDFNFYPESLLDLYIRNGHANVSIVREEHFSGSIHLPRHIMQNISAEWSGGGNPAVPVYNSAIIQAYRSRSAMPINGAVPAITAPFIVNPILKHNFLLKSAYDYSGSNTFTTWVSSQKKSCDFVYYGSLAGVGAELKVASILELPRRNSPELRNIKGIPSLFHGLASDHVVLVVKFFA